MPDHDNEPIDHPTSPMGPGEENPPIPEGPPMPGMDSAQTQAIRALIMESIRSALASPSGAPDQVPRTGQAGADQSAHVSAGLQPPPDSLGPLDEAGNPNHSTLPRMAAVGDEP